MRQRERQRRGRLEGGRETAEQEGGGRGRWEEAAFFGNEELAGACSPREAVGAGRRLDPRGCTLPSLGTATPSRLPLTSCWFRQLAIPGVCRLAAQRRPEPVSAARPDQHPGERPGPAAGRGFAVSAPGLGFLWGRLPGRRPPEELRAGRKPRALSPFRGLPPFRHAAPAPAFEAVTLTAPSAQPLRGTGGKEEGSPLGTWQTFPKPHSSLSLEIVTSPFR